MSENREQKILDVMFQCLMVVNNFKDDPEEVAKWARTQLRDNGIDTTPQGMSWAVLRT